MANFISNVKFNLSVKIVEVKIPPQLFDSLERAGCIESYVGEEGFVLWGKYPVVIDRDAEDIDFVFDVGMTEVKSDEQF